MISLFPMKEYKVVLSGKASENGMSDKVQLFCKFFLCEVKICKV